MNKTLTTLGQLLMPAIFVTCLLFFSACSSTMHIKDVTYAKNWAHFQVTFKKNTSTEEKQKAFILLEKYIINEFLKFNPYPISSFHFGLKQISTNIDNYSFNVGFDVLGPAASNGVVPISPGHGPRIPTEGFSQFIIGITLTYNSGQSLPGIQNEIK